MTTEVANTRKVIRNRKSNVPHTWMKREKRWRRKDLLTIIMLNDRFKRSIGAGSMIIQVSKGNSFFLFFRVSRNLISMKLVMRLCENKR